MKPVRSSSKPYYIEFNSRLVVKQSSSRCDLCGEYGKRGEEWEWGEQGRRSFRHHKKCRLALNSGEKVGG